MRFNIGKAKIISKPWGREVWIANEPEYGGKILELKKGYTTSLHYHKLKKETLYVLKGKLKIYFKGGSLEENIVVREGDFITINPQTPHRLESLEDAVIVEVSTQPINERVRVEDYYGDIGRE